MINMVRIIIEIFGEFFLENKRHSVINGISVSWIIDRMV